MSRDQGHEMRVLLAGGGTAGHVFPALAVARELDRRGCDVIWVGRERGMERDLVEARGIEYRGLNARPWVGRSGFGRIRALTTVAASAVGARRLVRSSGVAVTVGTGGFVSVPAVVGSRLARRPVLLLEPNARAGTANRWLSRISAAACTGYEETAAELACPSHWTGTPVRDEFFARSPVREEIGLLILGGSQGARQINQLLPEVLERLATKVGRLTVLHQVGRTNLDATQKDYEGRTLRGISVDVVPFIDDMAAAMHRAQVIISRAGALTLAEISASGRPSLLLPLAAAGGHQRANAQRLQDVGAAILLTGDESLAERMVEMLGELLVDQDRRERMGKAARSLARPDAARQIADLVQSLGRAA